ncbi:tetratricopeptide repeat protein, partial [Crocosphaera watsonii]
MSKAFQCYRFLSKVSKLLPLSQKIFKSQPLTNQSSHRVIDHINEENLKLNPEKKAQFKLDLGNKLIQQGQVEEALKYYDLAIKLRPNWPEAYYYQGN